MGLHQRIVARLNGGPQRWIHGDNDHFRQGQRPKVELQLVPVEQCAHVTSPPAVTWKALGEACIQEGNVAVTVALPTAV